jgi:hypothetical protein
MVKGFAAAFCVNLEAIYIYSTRRTLGTGGEWRWYGVLRAHTTAACLAEGLVRLRLSAEIGPPILLDEVGKEALSLLLVALAVATACCLL